MLLTDPVPFADRSLATGGRTNSGHIVGRQSRHAVAFPGVIGARRDLVPFVVGAGAPPEMAIVETGAHVAYVVGLMSWGWLWFSTVDQGEAVDTPHLAVDARQPVTGADLAQRPDHAVVGFDLDEFEQDAFGLPHAGAASQRVAVALEPEKMGVAVPPSPVWLVAPFYVAPSHTTQPSAPDATSTAPRPVE